MAAANTASPGYQLPPRAPKCLLLSVAWCNEVLARLTGKAVQLTRSQVHTFYGVRQEYDIDKARTHLAYSPRPPEQALLETFAYLRQRPAG